MPPIHEGGLCLDADGDLCHVVEIRGDAVIGHSLKNCAPWGIDCTAESLNLGTTKQCRPARWLRND